MERQELSRQNVVIVGGGPAGLATALMLAKRGWTNISVLEKRETAGFYEPNKSFNYQIDGRGQKFTDLFGLTEQLSKISVKSTEFYLTTIYPQGTRKTLKLPIAGANRKTGYWLPRQAFVLLLYEEIEKNWRDRINILFESKCIEINKRNDVVELIAQLKNGDVIKFEPTLVVGCDGINSIVRQTLNKCVESTSERFEMKFLPSASSGLKYKVLTLPPKFPLSENKEDCSVSNMAYVIRGTFRGQNRAFSLGILPVKNPDALRSANIITKSDHEIWKINKSEELYNFLEQNFPQLPIRQIVSPLEIERFIQSEIGVFPTPQYCSELYFLSKQKPDNFESESRESSSSFVLLGDAVHCFPPDIGQGVNSALEDVCVLNQALQETNDNVLQALPLYESKRAADIKALTYLAQTTYPWQYNQDPFRKWLWGINFFIRFALSRLLPQIFSPPAFLLILDHQKDYDEIWNQVQRTNQIYYIAISVLVAIFFTFLVSIIT